MTFGCSAEKVHIEETDNPCEIKMITLPLDILNISGMTVKQVTQIVKTLLPICIRMDSLNLEGTFEFSNNENEFDSAKGFCNAEGGDDGGYLGYLSSDENEPILPI